jgi:activator of HSP90 ATPase
MIRKRYLIKVRPEKVWRALTDPEIIKMWGAGPAKMNDRAGTGFSLWGGDVWGKNLEVVNPESGEKRLVQEWYGGEWEVPSIVTFKLNADNDCTEIILEHKNVPKSEVNDISAGWDDYYLGPIKNLLENN